MKHLPRTYCDSTGETYCIVSPTVRLYLFLKKIYLSHVIYRVAFKTVHAVLYLPFCDVTESGSVVGGTVKNNMISTGHCDQYDNAAL